MRSYEAARTYFGVLEFFSWCVIVLGGLAVLIGLGAAGSMGRGFSSSASSMAYIGAVIPGAALAFAGFMGLVFSQMGRAGVDTAEYAQQSLDVARKHLEVSRQALKLGKPGETGFAALTSKDAAIPESPAVASYASTSSASGSRSGTPKALVAARETIEYRGKTITVMDGTLHFAGMTFSSREAAERYIDQLGVNPNAKLT